MPAQSRLARKRAYAGSEPILSELTVDQKSGVSEVAEKSNDAFD